MVKIAQKEDFYFFKNLYFHQDINPFLLYEMEEEANFEQIYDDLLKSDLLYTFSENGKKIGMFKLIRYHYRTNHTAYLGGVAIHPNYKGKGFGKKMIEAIVLFGKEKGLLRLELSTATTNETAIHLYEKMGFEKEGILKKYTFLKSENRYLDELMMAYIY